MWTSHPPCRHLPTSKGSIQRPPGRIDLRLTITVISTVTVMFAPWLQLFADAMARNWEQSRQLHCRLASWDGWKRNALTEKNITFVTQKQSSQKSQNSLVTFASPCLSNNKIAASAMPYSADIIISPTLKNARSNRFQYFERRDFQSSLLSITLLLRIVQISSQDWFSNFEQQKDHWLF